MPSELGGGDNNCPVGDTFGTFVEVFDRGDMLPLQDEEEGIRDKLLITGPGVLEGVKFDCRV